VAIRVLICDDHGIVRSGLRRLLATDPKIEVVAEAGDTDEVVRKARLEKPDIVLLDLALPGPSGLEAMPQLLALPSELKILVLSMHADPSYVRAAFSAGASGYLLKDSADGELLRAVHEVAAGRSYLHGTLGARLARDDVKEQAKVDGNPLSERERQVLRLLALGHTNQEIARMLYISVRTSETHRAHIMQKLRIERRSELVRYAIEHGIFTAEEKPPPDMPDRQPLAG